MSVEEKYPLSEHEENLLVNELLGSGAMFIILGIVFSIVFTGLRTGDWFWSVLQFARQPQSCLTAVAKQANPH